MKISCLFLFLATFLGCNKYEKQYLTDSPEIEYSKALLSYFSTYNFAGIKSIYSDSVKIYENSLEPYNLERLLATLKLTEATIEYQRLEDSLTIEMVINDSDEVWVHGWYLWKLKYKNSSKEIKIPVQSSWQFIDDKIVKEYSYYDSKYFDNR